MSVFVVRLDSPKYLAVAKVTLKVNYPFTVDDYTSQPLAVKAFDDKIYIAGLDGAIFTPLELRVVHADEECSTKTESPDCVKDGTEDGTKYLIRTSTDSHKGYLGVSKGFIQVFSSYADASYSMLIVNGDKVRIRYRNAENSEYTVVSMSPKIPIGIQSLKRCTSSYSISCPPVVKSMNPVTDEIKHSRDYVCNTFGRHTAKKNIR